MARRPVILVAALLALVGATPSAAFESTTAHTAPRAPNRAGAFRAGQVGGTGLAISSGAGLAAKLGGRALTRAALMAAGGGATNALLGAVGALFNCDPYDASDAIRRFAVGALLGPAGATALRYGARWATRGAELADPAAIRATLRVGTKTEIRAAAPKTAGGDFIDPNTGQVIPKNGPFDYGHKPGFEWWRTQARARDEGWTRERVLEHENDPSHYQIEDPSANRSHRYEGPR
jgi:hypothetical protein